jgi:hypothetical protein
LKKKVLMATIMVISLLLPLFILPAQATSPLLEVFQLKEYKQFTSYNPSFTFSKSSSSVLQMMSDDAGNGDAYAFMHIAKDYLDGKKLRVSWRWYYDYNDDPVTLSYLYVVDHQHDRRLSNSGEFSTSNNAEHPVTDYNYVTACSYPATSNGGWVSWQTATSNVLDLSSFSSSTVTIMIKNVDHWIADTVGLQVDYLQILDSSNNVLKEYHFTGGVFMDKTGSTYDYGLTRKTTSMLYGTQDYVGIGATPGEDTLSDAVSDYIHGLFCNTGVYSYLADSWGDNTEPSTVYATTDTCERYYDYSAVFYKGHIWQWTANNPDDCDYPNCNLVHYGVFNDNGEQAIADYNIEDEVKEVLDETDKFAGTHDFVFIWACGHSDYALGIYDEDHSSGLLASWMGIDPASLDSDAYSSNVGTTNHNDHVFISFDWVSIEYSATAYGSYNYGHWAYLFYDYLLQGYTVNEALDLATEDTHNNLSYGSCALHTGFDAWNPIDQCMDTSYMHVMGDGDHKIPN